MEYVVLFIGVFLVLVAFNVFRKADVEAEREEREEKFFKREMIISKRLELATDEKTRVQLLAEFESLCTDFINETEKEKE